MTTRGRSDPGSGSGPSRYPGTFLLAFREALAEVGWQASRWMGDAVACTDAEGQEHIVGLENLFRRARRLEREEWPELIAEFLHTLHAAEDETELPTDLNALANQVLVRVGPPIKLGDADEGPAVWSQPLEGTGLHVNLVIDYPNRMCYVSNDLVAGSGKPGSEWLETALNNLKARTPADCLQVIDEETGIRLCGVADAYDSSRALLLDHLLPELGEEGCFVSLPGRDELLVLPVTQESIAYVHLLKVLAEKNYKTTPYPITDEVFWVRQGKWRVFRVRFQGQKVTIEPPEEFVAILERLIPPEELTDEEEGPDI